MSERDPLSSYHAIFAVLEGIALQAHKDGRKEIHVEDIMKGVANSAQIATNLYEHYKAKNGR